MPIKPTSRASLLLAVASLVVTGFALSGCASLPDQETSAGSSSPGARQDTGEPVTALRRLGEKLTPPAPVAAPGTQPAAERLIRQPPNTLGIVVPPTE